MVAYFVWILAISRVENRIWKYDNDISRKPYPYKYGIRTYTEVLITCVRGTEVSN